MVQDADMNVGKYRIVALITIVSSPFGVLQENNYHAPIGFRIREWVVLPYDKNS